MREGPSIGRICGSGEASSAHCESPGEAHQVCWREGTRRPQEWRMAEQADREDRTDAERGAPAVGPVEPEAVQAAVGDALGEIQTPAQAAQVADAALQAAGATTETAI